MEKVGKIGFFLILLCLSIGYMLFEATTLTISRFDFPCTTCGNSLKIAVLTDLHFRKMGSLENKLQTTLLRENPDLILIAGDTLDSERSLPVAQTLFSKLNPRLGILATLGNWENWKNLNSPSLFQSFGTTLLRNESYRANNDISIYAFDDLSGDPDTTFVRSRLENKFCIALVHSPLIFDTIQGICPLVLAGHTHGGQIRLPFLNPLWLPKGSGKYVSGWYKTKESQLYVSRGIGTSILPLRFFSAPELVLITLKEKI